MRLFGVSFRHVVPAALTKGGDVLPGKKRMSSTKNPEAVDRRGSESQNSSPDDQSFVNIPSSADIPCANGAQVPEVSTSIILSFCQLRVLRNYHRLLAVVGWKPLFEWGRWCARTVNTLYVALLVFLVLVGHLMQYAACFRRDGHYDEPIPKPPGSNATLPTMQDCPNSVGVYLIPAFMHLAAYFMMMTQMRCPESEQFQSLAEKVFLQSTGVWSAAKRRITRRLQGVYIAGSLWLISSVITQVVDIFSTSRVSFGTEGRTHYVLLAVLILCTVIQDFISMTIAIAYGIHCQLVLVYLQNLNQSLRERKLATITYYRGCCEIIKSIRYINGKQATAVTIQTVWLLCRLFASTEAFLEIGGEDKPLETIFAAVNVFLWLTLLLIPLIQASRLTSTCSHVQELGLELHSRPFGFQEVPISEMNSLLMFTNGFKIRAKLCSLVVTKQRVVGLFLLLLTAIIIALQRGSLHLVN